LGARLVGGLGYLKRRSCEKPSPFSNPCKDLSDLDFGPNWSAKVGLENQDEKQEQREQSSENGQQEEKNDRNSVLSGRAQPNAASYHACQNGQDRQPRQNIERSYPAPGTQRKK
jgi:hypothetical protein